MIYIPASAGVSLDEAERIRQQLLHGVVPPGMPAGGGILAMNPAHKLYWGNDTDLYRGAAGVVQTDGALNAANGYECNGSYGTAGQVLATNSTANGCSLGNCADWQHRYLEPFRLDEYRSKQRKCSGLEFVNGEMDSWNGGQRGGGQGCAGSLTGTLALTPPCYIRLHRLECSGCADTRM